MSDVDYNNAMLTKDAYIDKLEAEIVELKRTIDKQASIAIHSIDAAKEYANSLKEDARRLYAMCDVESLDGERKANAQLTEDLLHVEAERDELLSKLIEYDKISKE